MIKGFLAYELALKLHTQCEAIKAKPHVKDQLERASLSVVLNLAEGSAKPTPKEQRRIYAIAFGSLRETQALLDIIKAEEAASSAERLGGMLWRLVHPSGH